MWEIGTIDVEKYRKCSCKAILTERVILTDNRYEHIVERRGIGFVERYFERFAEIISEPDYIFRDRNDATALAAKRYTENGESVIVVVRLAVEGDNPNYMNSIITVVKEGERRFDQRLRNSTPIYIREE